MKFHIQCGTYHEDFILPEGSTIIGRARECRLRLKFAGVAPQHAQCYFDGHEKVVLKRLLPQMPVLVNGENIERYDLRPGDTVHLGQASLTLEKVPDESVPEEDASLEETADVPPRQGVSFEEAPAYEPGMEMASREERLPIKRPELAPVHTPEGRPTELLNRDGKWFLRDLVTNQEVEITPVEAQAHQSNLAAPPENLPGIVTVDAEVKRARSSRKFLIPSVIVLLVAGIFVLQYREEAKPGKPPAEEFDRRVRFGFALLAQGETARAAVNFNEARHLVPDSKLPEILLEAAEVEKKAGDSFRTYPWNIAEALYRELEAHPDSSAEMREFARQRMELITRYRIQLNTFNEARQLEAGGKFIEAYNQSRGIPADSLARKQRPEWFQQIVPKAAGFAMAQARVAFEHQQWEKALELARQVRTILPDHPEAAAFIEKALQSQDAVLRLSRAQQLVAGAEKEKGGPGKVSTRLRQALLELQAGQDQPVFTGTAIENDRANLVARIQKKLIGLAMAERVETIRNLYAQGHGEEALRIIREKGQELPLDIRGLEAKIQSVVDASARASEQFEKKQYERARKLWKKVAREEPDEINEYHRRAQEQLDWFRRNASLLADEYRKWALVLIEDKPSEARRLIKSALQWDPANPAAEKVINDLDKRAELFFRLGYTLRDKDPVRAKENFRQATKFADPDSELAIKAGRELVKLQEP